jgi:hypothetical protein
VRLPPAKLFDFTAWGLSTPHRTWPGWPTLYTFTVTTE